MEVGTKIRDSCILSWVSESMTVTHDLYVPSKIGDPFDPLSASFHVGLMDPVARYVTGG